MKTYKIIIFGTLLFLAGIAAGVWFGRTSPAEIAKAEYHTYTDAYFTGYQDAIYAMKNNIGTAGVIQTQYLYRVVQIVDDDLPEAESRELWNTYQTCNWAGE